MMKKSLSVLEKIKFGQKFDRNIVTLCGLSKLTNRLSLILSIAKIFQKIGIENLISRIGNQFSINIVRLNLNIDRKFDNCNHNFLVFKVSAFVLKDSSGDENIHPERPSLINLGQENVPKYSNVNHSLSIG